MSACSGIDCIVCARVNIIRELELGSWQDACSGNETGIKWGLLLNSPVHRIGVGREQYSSIERSQLTALRGIEKTLVCTVAGWPFAVVVGPKESPIRAVGLSINEALVPLLVRSGQPSTFVETLVRMLPPFVTRDVYKAALRRLRRYFLSSQPFAQAQQRPRSEQHVTVW
eukprot:1900643-Prymnesium_polylepis.2